jgi:hypothetical protein
MCFASKVSKLSIVFAIYWMGHIFLPNMFITLYIYFFLDQTFGDSRYSNERDYSSWESQQSYIAKCCSYHH